MSLIKQNNRKLYRKVLSQFSDSERKSKSLKLSLNLLRLFSLPHFPPVLSDPSLIIGGFAPLKDEAIWYLHLMPLEKQFAFPGAVDLSLSKRAAPPMAFFRSTLSQLKISESLGGKIKTPQLLSEHEVRPSVLLIPGLAFSQKGERLGRGKGFYDRYLESFNGVKIGLCFQEQLTSSLPKEEHDQNMDYILTDEEILVINE